MMRCRLEGDFRGWMLAMSLKDDPDQQLRIRGIFADIQYLVKHIPNAQVGLKCIVWLQHYLSFQLCCWQAVSLSKS